jgi:hypothetical protein
MNYTRRALMVLAAVAAVVLSFAVPASATDTYYTWGEKTQSFYHYGNPDLGEFEVTAWVDELDRDFNNDGLPDAMYIRGHGRNCKVSRVLRTQVDYVRLGNATQGGVLAENRTAKNSGTAPCADSVTAWVPVADSFTCGTTFEAWTRAGVSARWSDLQLSSNVSLLSYRSIMDWCRTAGGTADKQR